MATPSASHMVGRCFVATEKGTYFDGTGFLKAGEIDIDLSLDLSLVCKILLKSKQVVIVF